MMPAFETFRPQIRDGLLFGPSMISGDTTVHYIKDTLTNRFYRIGVREYFLIRNMNGKKTIQEIEAEYEQVFHRRLSKQAWSQLFRLLGQRALLLQATDADTLEQVKRRAEEQRSMPARGRIALRNVDGWLEKWMPWTRLAFHSAFVWPMLIAIVLFEAFFFWHATTAISELLPGVLNHFLCLPLVIALSCVFIAAHELAHGLACKRFGGSVQEIGLGWRFFLPYTYCKIDDVVLFKHRRHRVYTAFAGIFVNLLMIIPFALMWWFSPQQSFMRIMGDSVMVLVNLLTLANCLPFVELDGYLMLKYALNMVDLRMDSYRAWQQIFARKRDKSDIGQKSHNHRIYLIYGCFSVIYMLLCTGGFLFFLILLGRGLWHG